MNIVSKIRELELELSYLKSSKTANNSQNEIIETPVFSFRDLVDVNQLQELMDLFYDLVGLPIGILDESKNVFVSTGWQDVCTKFHRIHPETCKRCTESDNFIAKMQNGNNPVEYKCKNGMWDIAIPILIDGKILAAVYFGQFFYDDELIDFDFFEKQAEQFGFDKQAYLSAIKKVPILSHKKVDSIINYYAKLAQLIADTGYQNLIIKQEQIQERQFSRQMLIESENKFKAIFETVQVGINITDYEGIITDCNEKFVNFLGASKEQVIGGKYDARKWKLIRPDFSEMPQEELASYRAIKENKIITGVVLGIVRDEAHITWVSVNALPMNIDGFGVLITYSDISNVFTLNSELEKTKNQLELIVDNLPIFISQIDHNFKYSFVNKHYSKIYGKSKQEIVGKSVYDIIGKEAHLKFIEHFKSVFFEDNGKVEFENKIKNKLGEDIILQIILIPEIENGKVVGIYSLGIDITRQNSLKQKLIETTELLTSITDNVPAMIGVLDRDFKFVFTNKYVEDIFEKKSNDLIGKNLIDLLGQEEFDKALPFIIKSLSGGIIKYENKFQQKDGSIIYVQNEILPFCHNKEIIGILVLSVDISQIKIRKLALIESEARFKNMFEKHSSIMLLIDPDSGKIINANKSAAEFYGGSINKLCEKNINEINALPPEEVAKEMEKAITEKRNYFIFTHRLFSGEERTVEVHSSPIIYDNNKLLFSIIYDITERTIAEKDLMRQDEELRKLNDDKNRFISILGHDLKGPLYSIRGLLEIIAPNIRDYSIDETESFINMIYSSVQNTTVLLEDILMWAMSNSGRIPFEPQLINIGKVCENIIENIQQVAKEKDISISYTSNMDINVLADLDMIKTIIRNLISNAIKFTNRNGAIDISAEINPINLKIIVSDNGVGIRPEIMNKLFDLSQKITSIGTANEKGTGLGLLLCKEFVKMHGGEIWVESEVGKGSNFIFTLPLIK